MKSRLAGCQQCSETWPLAPTGCLVASFLRRGECCARGSWQVVGESDSSLPRSRGGLLGSWDRTGPSWLLEGSLLLPCAQCACLVLAELVHITVTSFPRDTLLDLLLWPRFCCSRRALQFDQALEPHPVCGLVYPSSPPTVLCTLLYTLTPPHLMASFTSCHCS